MKGAIVSWCTVHTCIVINILFNICINIDSDTVLINEEPRFPLVMSGQLTGQLHVELYWNVTPIGGYCNLFG